jgi:peptidoglycan/LPS O-acetylase OafA/YrhL
VLLGDASYSLYLLHSIVIPRVFDGTPSLAWPLRATLLFFAAVAASLLSYLLVEEPCRKLLRPRPTESRRRVLSAEPN